MSQIIDTRLLGKGLKEFDGDERKWPVWSFTFENYCGAISADMLNVMEQSKATTEPIPLTDIPETKRQHCANLAYILTNLVQGEMKKVFRKIERGNGCEMWRRMCARYEPKDKNTRLGLLNAIMGFDFGLSF